MQITKAKQRKRPVQLTLERARQMLNYDPKTGEFSWRELPRWNFPKWQKPGHVCRNGYVRIYIDGEGHLAHRLAWFLIHGEWPSQLDHCDGNRANNRLTNLRISSSSQNHQNKRLMSNNKSGLKGAWWCAETGKWQSAIKVHGKVVTLGRKFETKEAAHEAYCDAAQKYFGQYARSA